MSSFRLRVISNSTSCEAAPGLVDRVSFWGSSAQVGHAAVRDGLLRPALDGARENRSLEGSFPVAAPVAFSFEAFALSEQSARSLRLSGDKNQLSSSAIPPSGDFG